MASPRIAMSMLLALGLSAVALAGAGKPILLEGDGQRRAALDRMHDKPAPPMALENWTNTDARSLKDLKGKVVLVDFWGVWCAPCVRAVPALNAMAEKYADDGLVVLGVHTTNQAEKMAQFVKQHDVRYPVASDIDDKTVQRYLVDSYPDMYLIDHEGRLRFGDIVNMREDNVEAAVHMLLQERNADEGGR